MGELKGDLGRLQGTQGDSGGLQGTGRGNMGTQRDWGGTQQDWGGTCRGSNFLIEPFFRGAVSVKTTQKCWKPCFWGQKRLETFWNVNELFIVKLFSTTFVYDIFP